MSGVRLIRLYDKFIFIAIVGAFFCLDCGYDFALPTTHHCVGNIGA
jgi:hypothetical protein